MADEELMSRVVQMDADAFSMVYDRHSSAVYGLSYRMCGQNALAEDVTQEAFACLWRKANSYHASKGSLRSWLLTLTHHQAVDALRRQSSHTRGAHSYDPADLEGMLQSSQPATDLSERDRMLTHLSLIPENQQQVVLMAFYGGFTHTEIAEILEVPAGTVKSRMHTALSRLRVLLAQEDTALGDALREEADALSPA